MNAGGIAMRTDEEIIRIIDEAIKSIWVNEIRNDYENRRLLKEDTLKNALYFHLRNRIGWLCDECDLRIFTEFTDDKFRGTGILSASYVLPWALTVHPTTSG